MSTAGSPLGVCGTVDAVTVRLHHLQIGRQGTPCTKVHIAARAPPFNILQRGVAQHLPLMIALNACRAGLPVLRGGEVWVLRGLIHWLPVTCLLLLLLLLVVSMPCW